MKYLAVVLIICLGPFTNAQPAWKCIYSDTAFLALSDSTMNGFKAGLKEQNLPDTVIDSMIAKMKSTPYYKARKRYVIANADSTLISAEGSWESNLQVNFYGDEELLLKQDEVYVKSVTGRYDSLRSTSRRTFQETGRRSVFFNYVCMEYISSDSTYTLWVTKELPACINPGIRTGGLKAAVLFYELRKPGLVNIRCGIIELKQADQKK